MPTVNGHFLYLNAGTVCLCLGVSDGRGGLPVEMLLDDGRHFKWRGDSLDCRRVFDVVC